MNVYLQLSGALLYCNMSVIADAVTFWSISPFSFPPAKQVEFKDIKETVRINSNSVREAKKNYDIKNESLKKCSAEIEVCLSF